MNLLPLIAPMRFRKSFPFKQASPGVRSAGLLLILSLLPCSAASPKDAALKTDFNRDVRSILTENCFKCHGPDDGSRKAKLRLDVRTEALKPAKSGSLPIVPGAPEKSELIARITATDPDDRMPPIKSGKTLTQTQIQ